MTAHSNSAGLTPHEAMDAARSMVAANLPELANEWLEWQQTSVLKDGKLREMARILQAVSIYDALSIAENLLKAAAMEVVATPAQDESEAVRALAAFEAQYRPGNGYAGTPIPLERSPTGQAYASPWVQERWVHFSAGYQAATRAAPPAPDAVKVNIAALVATAPEGVDAMTLRHYIQALHPGVNASRLIQVAIDKGVVVIGKGMRIWGPAPPGSATTATDAVEESADTQEVAAMLSWCRERELFDDHDDERPAIVDMLDEHENALLDDIERLQKYAPSPEQILTALTQGTTPAQGESEAVRVLASIWDAWRHEAHGDDSSIIANRGEQIKAALAAAGVTASDEGEGG